MIVVTVELRPGGDPLRTRTLETLSIVNDGSGNFDVGAYDVTAGGGRKARVEGFVRSDGAMKLVLKALQALAGEAGAAGSPPETQP